MHIDRYNKLLSEDLSVVDPVAAPDMGDYETGKAGFAGVYPGPYYVRSGGIPSSQLLVAHTLKDIIKGAPNDAGHLSHTIATPNGQLANYAVLYNIMQVSKNIVVSPYIFGSTSNLIGDLSEDLDCEVKIADPRDPQSLADQITPDTRAVFMEDISNPIGLVADLQGAREVADRHNVMLIVDNTLSAGQSKSDPMQYADIVTLSLTKQAGGGNNENVGGIMAFNPRSDWDRHAHHFPKVKKFFGDKAKELPNPVGHMFSKLGQFRGFSNISPKDALDIARHLHTVEDNLNVMSDNAKIVANFLQNHPAIKSVQLTGYGDTENDKRMQQYFGDHHYVVFAEMAGGNTAVRDFINLEETFHGVALGQKQTAWTPPITTTHRQIANDPEKQRAVGITDAHIRGSIGTEDPEQLIEQLSRSLEMID